MVVCDVPFVACAKIAAVRPTFVSVVRAVAGSDASVGSTAPAHTMAPHTNVFAVRAPGATAVVFNPEDPDVVATSTGVARTAPADDSTDTQHSAAVGVVAPVVTYQYSFVGVASRGIHSFVR